MKALLYGAILMVAPVFSFATWTETDTTGRSLSSGYGIGTVDHYSGTVSLNHNDYSMILGPNSTLPLNRRTDIEYNASYGTPDFNHYNLGQMSGVDTVSNTLCSEEKVVIRGLNGESVVFSEKYHDPANDRLLTSKNNWLLECLTDESDFVVKVSAPTGLSFYYEGRSNVSYLYGGHLPSRIEDSNGNAISLEIASSRAVTMTSSYQKLRLDDSGIRIEGADYPIARFESISRGYRVTYIEDREGANVSSWTVQRLSSVQTKVCSPLGTCATYRLQLEHLGGMSTYRLNEAIYQIPHQGTYTLTYDYKYSGSSKTLTTTVQHPGHRRTYEYEHRNQGQTVGFWKDGALLRERLMTPNGSDYYEEISYAYSPSHLVGLGSEAKGEVVPLLDKKTTKRRSNGTTTGNFRSLGTVEEIYENYDTWHRAGKVTYRYPGSNPAFPNISYLTEWADIEDVHRLDRVRKTQVEGQPYYNQYSYDNRGNLTAQESNGLISRFTYDSQGHLTSKTDPEGNRFDYSLFAYGIPKRETGPEGYELTREVSNGFITSETLYGDRTTQYEYNLLGTLLKVTHPESNRASVEYFYSMPDSGGMIKVKSIGTFLEKTHYNGMGLPYLVETIGTGVGGGESYHYKQSFEYDFNGNLLAESIPVEAATTITAQHKTHYQQDPSGRRFRMDAADGNRIEFFYDSPFRIEMTDQAGVRTIERYRPFGGFGSEQLISRVHPQGNTQASAQVELTINYNDLGWIQWAAVGPHEHVYTYNDEGFIEEVSTPETGPIRYEYNRNGQITREQRNSDTPIHYDYDGLGRLTRERYADSSQDVIYTYNEQARETRMVKGAYSTETNYNLDGQVTREYIKHDTQIEPPSFVADYPVYVLHTPTPRSAGGSGGDPEIVRRNIRFQGEQVRGQKGYLDWEFLYDYDSSGNLTRIIYPNGEVVPYTRNRLGQATQVGEYASNITYYPNGGLKSLHYGNGIETRYSQEATSGRLARIQHGSLWDRSYSYQNASYLSSIRDNLNPSNSLHFEYDQLYQLKRVYGSNSAGTVNRSNLLEQFTYAVGGDITQKVSRGVTHRYVYDNTTNRLDSVTRSTGEALNIDYTPDGRIRRIDEENNDSEPEIYQYSANKSMTGYQPSAISQLRYDYDAQGNKIRTTLNGQLENYSIYNHLGQLLFQEDITDHTVLNMYLNDRLIARRSTEYNINYADCQPLRHDVQGQTMLFHRPVYIRRSDGEPVFWGPCEASGLTWEHKPDQSTAYWRTISSTVRRMYARVNQVDHDTDGNLVNMGHLYNYKHYEDVKRLVGNPIRRYHTSGSKRTYKCYQRWVIDRYTYNIRGERVGEPIELRSGDYYNGRSKSWRAWQSKPSFSCGGQRAIETSKIPWPSVEG
ncbi:RHS repeat domain-containing protein [Saccharospirillum impatiens]|uniref:RHS repeat domain-containing protein n=1 Tax=Saccharospirillum impatiens TaxID=169438 RepID=UPI000405422F|nr:RHS repeat domain-containing protein [Saccharospirillum impatiens]